MLRSLLEGVTAELNGLPKESKEEGVEQQRGLLQKRLLLLQEYGEVVERLRVLKSGSGERRLQEEALKKSLEQMALQAPPKAPERPTPEAFKQVQEALEKANQGVELLTAQAKERQLLLGQIPEKSVAAKERWQQAELVLQQSRELVAKAEGSKKRLLTLQAENARLDGLIAQALGLRWEAEQAAAMEGVTLHDRQLEIAQANRQYQQKKFALYQEALNSRQAADLTVRQEELQKKEQAARQASSPEQIFLTRWELEIARLQKESADLSKWQTDLVAAVSEQEHLLQNEKDELKNLETLTRQFGAQGLAADILKDNFTRLTRRRWELREPLHPELLERIADLQPRLFLMDSALVELNSSWTATMAEIQARLPTAGEKEYFAQLANGLRNNYRQLLSTGKRQIFDLQASGQRLQLLTLERTSTLNATETFLVSRIFWIQDAPPLGMAVLQQLVDELFSSVRPTALPNVWRHGWTAGWIESAWETLRKPTTLLAGLFLLGLLPPFLWWASRRLRSVVVAASPPAGGQAAPVRAEAVVAQLLQPALGPLYLLTLYLASHLFTAPIPMVAAAQPLLFHVLQQGGLSLALFWFLWESNRQLLTVHGPAERLLRLHPDVRGSLARTLESALLASLLFLPAWYIFRAAPFHYEALPRLSYTLFECSIAFLLYRLMRADAPLPRHAFAAPAAHHPPVAAAKRVSPLLFSRHWTGISRLLSLAMGVVVGLDVAGYRFGAAWLAANGMRTILTFFLLIGLYRAAAPVRAEAVVAQLLQPALGPLYLLTLYLASHLFTAPIPMVAAAQPLLFHVLQQGGLSLALFWFLWESNRQLLTVHGPAERLLRLHPDVRGSLARTLESALLASLLFLPAWYIFRAAPFHYEALPRLSYTLFECSIAFLLYRLMRADAPLPRHAFAAPAAHHPPVAAAKRVSPLLFSRHWTGISRLLSLAMGVVVGLDVAGYRFGAAWLAANGMRTILTFFLLIGLYRALASAVEALIRRRRRMPTVLAPGARGTLTRSQIARQINDSLRLLFILGGLVLMSSYWGVHEHLFQLFKGVTLYNTTSNDGQLVLVTLLDFVHFLLTLLVVGWVVKHLPRIYELLLFSWLSLDAGSRYAVLTISRYLIFIIGLLTALNNLHLDIAKIGWLVAAISVGIGFGLQEIVANFVSGIILLLERPVRVGDMITIGNTITGRITRINIRATTVLNTDYQEQLIPNRDLITKEVTNWTLANNTLRIVVPIGVAYGSDIGQVKQLLLDLARAQPEVLAEPPPEALFTHHGASSLDFELRVFLPDPGLRWVIRDRLNTEINRAFIQHGIEIPFPQQEVRIRASELTGAG
ncbi:MAG: mechanosensitive ion channel [Magnetococcus sp. XQGC-1]